MNHHRNSAGCSRPGSFRCSGEDDVTHWWWESWDVALSHYVTLSQSYRRDSELTQGATCDYQDHHHDQGGGRRSHAAHCWSLITNESVALLSVLRLWCLIKAEGEEVMTPRPASLNITFRSSDQIYIVSPERREVVTSQCGRALCLPEWAAGPRRLELDWSHWAESRVLWGNSSFVLHAPLMMNEITRFYSRRKKRKLSSYFKLYHCIRIVLLLFKT